MKPDYAKATADLLEKLRRNATAASAHQRPSLPTINSHGGVIINAPRDCVIYITPHQPPTPPSQN